MQPLKPEWGSGGAASLVAFIPSLVAFIPPDWVLPYFETMFHFYPMAAGTHTMRQGRCPSRSLRGRCRGRGTWRVG